ncbi:MAG TPA: LacI family DNA-binding transcriptional regulator [Anaerolineales bacterium]|jgi:LacI family transcriptional regulator
MTSNIKKIPTIYDVAQLSGVSISTISRVLNSPEKVNPETRTQVLKAIDELAFVPRAEARARALRSTGRIGVITPFFTAPSFVQRMRGIAAALSKEKQELVVYTVESSSQLKNYLASLPLTGNLDGLIIMSLPVMEEDARRLLEHKLPTVLIEYPFPSLSSVEIDDAAGGRLAAEYLIGKGHRRIAFLGDTNLPEYAIHPVSLRLAGFREALKQAGLQLPDEFVRLAPFSQEQTRRAASELLRTQQPPTAVFAATDFQAFGVLKAARQLGVNIPAQLAVLGFDDLDWAEYADLTTVRQHLDESGRLAIELLLSRIADPFRPPQHIHLPLTIVERATV